MRLEGGGGPTSIDGCEKGIIHESDISLRIYSCTSARFDCGETHVRCAVKHHASPSVVGGINFNVLIPTHPLLVVRDVPLVSPLRDESEKKNHLWYTYAHTLTYAHSVPRPSFARACVTRTSRSTFHLSYLSFQLPPAADHAHIFFLPGGSPRWRGVLGVRGKGFRTRDNSLAFHRYRIGE